MLRQDIKDMYFILNRWLVRPSTSLARLRYGSPRWPEGHYLHLGCGDRYLEGMINIDGNFRRRKDAWLDLRNKLPFASDSTYLAYCCHTLEHLYPHEAIRLLSEIQRILRPDGVARIAVPSFERCMRIAEGSCTSVWPRRFRTSTAQAINYLFCDGQHKYAYSLELLSELAVTAGFRSVIPIPGDTPEEKQYGRVRLGGEPNGSLIVELSKSASPADKAESAGSAAGVCGVATTP